MSTTEPVKFLMLFIVITSAFIGTTAMALEASQPCPLLKTTALNPKTGNKIIFLTPCDVPRTWDIIFINESDDTGIINKTRNIGKKIWGDSESHRSEAWTWGKKVANSFGTLVDRGIDKASQQINEPENEKIIADSKSVIEGMWDSLKSVFSK